MSTGSHCWSRHRRILQAKQMHLELHLHARFTFDILQSIQSMSNLAEYAAVCQDDSRMTYICSLKVKSTQTGNRENTTPGIRWK